MEINNLKIEKILLDPINLIGCKAPHFPEGISKAWNEIEGQLSTLRGRKFYGLTIPQKNLIDYYACVIPREHESLKGVPFYLESGEYIRVKLMDWREHTDQIAGIFDQLILLYQIKSKAITLEFYKSQNELHLLLPLSEINNTV